MKCFASLAAASLLVAVSLGADTDDPANDPQNHKEPLHYNFGVLGGQAIWATYTSISELADGFRHQVYDKDKTIELATRYIKMTHFARQSLTVLLKNSKREDTYAADVRSLLTSEDNLCESAQKLLAYVNNASAENLAAFNASLDKSAAAIDKYLGIDGR